MSYCGYITIIGKTNVGKSTLLNRLVGQHISITSCKPWTTQERIIGIHTENEYQAIYIDTPGVMYSKKDKKKISRLINHMALDSMKRSELVIFVLEGLSWTLEDDIIADKLNKTKHLQQVIVVINKIDKIFDKKKLLPYIRSINRKGNFREIIPVCAKNGENILTLSDVINRNLPNEKHHFHKYCISNNSKYFLASEIIREKIFHFFGDELPYTTMVHIEDITNIDQWNDIIYGIIIVKRLSQKKIIVGKKGEKIKKIIFKAKKDMENMFKKQIDLIIQIKIE